MQFLSSIEDVCYLWIELLWWLITDLLNACYFGWNFWAELRSFAILPRIRLILLNLGSPVSNYWSFMCLLYWSNFWAWLEILAISPLFWLTLYGGSLVLVCLVSGCSFWAWFFVIWLHFGLDTVNRGNQVDYPLFVSWMQFWARLRIIVIASVLLDTVNWGSQVSGNWLFIPLVSECIFWVVALAQR